MDYLHTVSFLAIIICTFSTYAFGQTATVTGPEGGATQAGRDVVLTCTPESGTSSLFIWSDESEVNPVQIVVNGGTISADPKYSNFASSPPGDELTITAAAVDDEGKYVCTVEGAISPSYALTVEVESTLTMTFSTDPLLADSEFTAMCDVIGSRPQLNISWTINNVALDVTPDVTNPTNTNPDLSNTRSEVTFTPTPEMNGQDLKCTTSGHVVTTLNREDTTQLNVQYAPMAETATIVVVPTKEGDTQLRVTCQVSAAVDGIDPANPAINNYTIYAGSEQIHSSTTDDSILVDIPENDTDYKCSAGNDLGSIESAAVNYDPGQTTTQPTTTEPPTSEPPTTEEPDEGDTSKSSSTMPMETNKTDTIPETRGLSTGAIVGIVIGVLLLIALVVVLVVIFVLKPDCISGKGSGPPPKTMALQEQKPTNGNSEVEKTPLNEVVTEKAAHPTAAPRQSSVPHRNDNPGGAVYAEVQKGGRGYDQPDHTHPPQGDSGMNYATLDLSEEAGHTERQVPQNKDNVVVYSSILV